MIVMVEEDIEITATIAESTSSQKNLPIGMVLDRSRAQGVTISSLKESANVMTQESGKRMIRLHHTY